MIIIGSLSLISSFSALFIDEPQDFHEENSTKKDQQEVHSPQNSTEEDNEAELKKSFPSEWQCAQKPSSNPV